MKRRPSPTGPAGLLLGVALTAALPAAAPGQVSAAVFGPPAAGRTAAAARQTAGYGAVAVLPRPWTTVVAVTLLFPVGSSSDPTGLEGSTFLLGETIRRTVERRVGEGAVEMTVDVQRSRTAFRLLAVPDRWQDAWEALEAAVFEGDLEPAAYESARLDLAEVFVFETGAPVREFETEAYRMLAGLESPWSHSPRGTEESLGRIRFADIVGTRMERFRRGAAVATVVGATTAEEGFRVVTDGTAPQQSGPMGAAVAVAGMPRAPDDEAWEDGGRLVMRRDVTNSWIAAAWPIDEETSWTAVEMLAHRLEESFNTTPPDPGLFDARVRIEDLEGRPVLVVQAAVLPEAAQGWERRVLAAVAHIEGEELEQRFFDWQRRRFRSLRLLAETAPEALGLRAAEDLLRTGRVRDLTREIWDLRPDDLAEAADDLGEPRILAFGPDLAEAGDR